MPGKGEKETEFNVTGRKGRDEEEEEEQEEEDTASDNRVTDIFKETVSQNSHDSVGGSFTLNVIAKKKSFSASLYGSFLHIYDQMYYKNLLSQSYYNLLHANVVQLQPQQC